MNNTDNTDTQKDTQKDTTKDSKNVIMSITRKRKRSYSEGSEYDSDSTEYTDTDSDTSSITNGIDTNNIIHTKRRKTDVSYKNCNSESETDTVSYDDTEEKILTIENLLKEYQDFLENNPLPPLPPSQNSVENSNIGKILIIGKPLAENAPIQAKPVDIFTEEQKKKIEETEKQLIELRKQKIPPRHKILLSEMSLASKSKVLENMDRIRSMNSHSSEYSKLTRWIDGVLKIPFGSYYEVPVTLSSSDTDITSYLSNIEETMDNCIYGQRQAKEKILEFVGKWITNPNATNEPLAFIGEKGTGKTTLAKEGIAKALGRPFYMISLGGESDAGSFRGHDYTYEGSRWGKIADILISTQCMNPVIFFDELDKISNTKAGEEIAGMLMHLTDTTQNDSFADKYFSGIDLDLSKAMFIFSYNDPHKLNPILRDRLTEIEFTSFGKKEKMVIVKDFLMEKACDNIGLQIQNYHITDSIISFLIERYTPRGESGVRNIKRVIETLFLRLNLYNLPQNLQISYNSLIIKKKNNKYNITKKVIETILQDMVRPISDCVLSMYT